MYYLTYRPKTIAEIDNSKPRESLKKILSSASIPHAFLFVGQKGTGKTSSARIFAKAVNCRNNKFACKGTDSEPCNSCAVCKSIDKSSFPDVLELDAASNRGINEIKELIREASFLPMAGNYRVFIIDEAHMITPDGFNALLKTLEEPPETVIFILATTNSEKLPKTIISRCIPVEFGQAQESEIIHMLKRITASEKLQLSDDILHLIAQHSDMSFRDGAKLLEELHMQGKLDTASARTYIGLRQKESLLAVLNTKSIADSLVWIESFSSSGGSVKVLIEEILQHLHKELMALHHLPSYKQTTTLTLTQVVLLMKLFQTAYVAIRQAPVPSIPLEIAVVEFYNKKSA